MLTVIAASTLPIYRRKEVDQLPRRQPSGVAYLNGDKWHVCLAVGFNPTLGEGEAFTLRAALNAAKEMAGARNTHEVRRVQPSA